jgi:hypothetical protein
MPEKKTIARAKRGARAGKSASTQAGELVREQLRHIRRGKQGAKSTKQAIAIGLSEARRSGVELPPRGSAATRRKGERDLAAGQRGRGRPAAKQSRAGQPAAATRKGSRGRKRSG